MYGLVVLLCAVLYTSVTRLHNIYVHSENISIGKDAKQSSTYSTYPASMALDKAHAYYGSFTSQDNPSWWEVDLRGYFNISNITVTATSYNIYMKNAYVEVMDKDVSLCSDVQVVWCGAVSSTVAAGEDFTFTCNATFPVRFVRVTRRSTSRVQRWIGHVDVQGEGTVKPYRSYYKPSKNKKVSEPFLTTSAMTAGDCGIVCHQHHSCIDFSYCATAPTEALSSHHVNDNSWTAYSMHCM
ncbi:uncharacterized protein LOC124292340 isoform X3 [Haliotis rubra]|uniref:uncharacterized protein LOC124292340 isoform X3 n=1 Tax=Haliotis rubra TaxID=36100 RepID=UPI001EE5C7D4|nr:uncharacterized protein LOC124292340 isoform X3 [Haliotis rubra]